MSGIDAEVAPDSRDPWRAFLWPTWEQRKKITYVQAWLVVVGAYLLWVPAWLMPQNFDDVSELLVAARWFFFMVEVFTEYAGWLLLVVALVAVWRKLRGLALAAGVMAALTLGPLAGDYLPRSTPVAEGPRFRVMSVNLLWLNRNSGAILGEIRAADPDVILVQEYSPWWHEVFVRELAADYPHHVSEPREDAFGAAIYSRLPFRDPPELLTSFGSRELPQFRAVVEVGGGAVAFYNTHLLPPIRFHYYMAREGQFSELLRTLKKEEFPIVLGGDFNFVAASPQARALEDAGMLDAHDLAGYGRAATWPVNGIMRYLPLPGFRIDHVYLSPELACTSLRTGSGEGSDHRPIIAELGFASVGRSQDRTP